MIPIALAIAFVALGAFLWSLKSGQFDDVEGPKYRMLFEDDGMDSTSSPQVDSTSGNESDKRKARKK